MGRKLQLNEKIQDKIYYYLCEGNSIKAVAKKLGIHRRTVYKWMNQDQDFKLMIEEARKIQAWTYIDDIIEIADDDSKDIIVDPNTGRKYPNAVNVARSKLKIAARKKLAGFYHPLKFNNKSQLSISSENNYFRGLTIITPQ